MNGPNCATLGADLLSNAGMIAKPEWDKSIPVLSRSGRRLNGPYAPRPEELRNSVEKDCTLIYKNPQWKGIL